MGDGGGSNRTSFATGDQHPRYTGGRIINETGYVRVTTGRTSNTMRYEHRMVVEQLMLEQAVLELLARDTEPMTLWNVASVPGKWAIQRTQAAAVVELLTAPPRIPPGVHVHHIDGDRQHNCPCNLMLLDAVLHRAITQAHRRYLRRQAAADVFRKLRELGELGNVNGKDIR